MQRISIKLTNESAFTDSSLRRMLRACFDAVGLTGKRIVSVKAHGRATDLSQWPAGVRGRAQINGRAIWMKVAPNAESLRFARVLHHEALHNLGARHKDYTPEIRYCAETWTPSWWSDELRLVEKPARAAPSIDEKRVARQKKLTSALAALARAETRQKRATTWVKKWKRRVGALERAMKKGEP